MPIYEEKLICPLSVRFTQEHIKTLFKDGRVVEASVEQIEAEPAGVADYDLVLSAPFPAIGVLRLSPLGYEGSRGCGDEVGHWFTLDNRRLYCLQRAAMKYWPRRVAAKVEILYTDPGLVRRKYDSTTFGASVTISHSCKDAPLWRWDWRTAVPACPLSAGPALREQKKKALEAVLIDDQRPTVDALLDAADDQPTSILARAFAFELAQSRIAAAGAAAQKPKARQGTARSATPSTAAASDDSDSSPRAEEARDAQQEAHKILAERAMAEINRRLRSPNSDGKVRIPTWNERYGGCLGSMRKFLESHPDVYTVLPEKEGKFRVYLAHAAVQARCDHPTGAAEGVVTPASRWVLDDAVESASAELRAQLDEGGAPGVVRINDWNVRYLRRLGTLRAFLERHPDKFVVVPVGGKSFRVAVALPAPPAGQCGQDCAA